MSILPGAQVLSPGVQMFSGEDINSVVRSPIRTNVVVAAGGETVTLDPYDQFLLIASSGTVATLTIKLPANPRINQGVSISFSEAVTALTIQDASGGAVDTTSGVIARAREYRRTSATTWRRWG